MDLADGEEEETGTRAELDRLVGESDVTRLRF